MKTVVSYTLEKCRKCLKCLRTCPTEAITIEHQRVQIHHHRCINCGKCIDGCLHQGLQAKGSTLVDIKSYDYTVCIVPSSMICGFTTHEEVEELFYAIKQLGFDEVVDLTHIEGQVVQETQLLAGSEVNKTMIASFCPVVNKYIEVKYPILLDALLPIDYPSEIAARQLRKQHHDKGNVGIFNCCECIAKLSLAKFPYGNNNFEVDHALAIVDIFPFIKSNMNKGRLPVTLCLEGLQSCNPNTIIHHPEYIIADGFDKIGNICEYAEFELLKDFKLMMLFPCFNGCLGGNLLWGNSYLKKNNIHQLCKYHQKPIATLPIEELYAESILDQDKDIRSIQDKLTFFAKVNHQLEQLPGYDCGACGYASCRIMAEEIACGTKTCKDCRILKNEVKQNESR